MSLPAFRQPVLTPQIPEFDPGSTQNKNMLVAKLLADMTSHIPFYRFQMGIETETIHLKIDSASIPKVIQLKRQ